MKVSVEHRVGQFSAKCHLEASALESCVDVSASAIVPDEFHISISDRTTCASVKFLGDCVLSPAVVDFDGVPWRQVFFDGHRGLVGSLQLVSHPFASTQTFAFACTSFFNCSGAPWTAEGKTIVFEMKPGLFVCALQPRLGATKFLAVITPVLKPWRFDDSRHRSMSTKIQLQNSEGCIEVMDSATSQLSLGVMNGMPWISVGDFVFDCFFSKLSCSDALSAVESELLNAVTQCECSVGDVQKGGATLTAVTEGLMFRFFAVQAGMKSLVGVWSGEPCQLPSIEKMIKSSSS